MARIQVDMFEVQLGAALLLQFQTKTERVIRVLADAGVAAGGYSKHHVHNKLDEAFVAFGNKQRYLDLIIGTHYDADHLEGLVSIIDDKSIHIREAWMPPVANDAEPHPADQRVEDRHFLGRQFVGKNGERVLNAYLHAKADICQQLEELEWMGYERSRQISDKPRLHDIKKEHEKTSLQFFKQHVESANATLGEYEYSHADEDFPADVLLSSNLSSDLRLFLLGAPSRNNMNVQELFRGCGDDSQSLAAAQMRSIAYIRRSSARDAINATSLAKVVKSLKAREIPTSYNMVQDGQPPSFCLEGC
jgi:hypothetical protein